MCPLFTVKVFRTSMLSYSFKFGVTKTKKKWVNWFLISCILKSFVLRENVERPNLIVQQKVGEDLFWAFNLELFNFELWCHKKIFPWESFVWMENVELCSNLTFLATTIKDTPTNPHIHHRTTIFKAITFIVTSQLALAMINIPRCPFLRIRRLGLCTAVNSLKVFSYFSFLLKREGCEFHF